MSPNSKNWMNRMISEPYYLLHFLAFFSYIPVRCSAAHVLAPPGSAHLLHREIQALLAFCVLAAVKVVKRESWEAFIADTLFFAKIFLAAIALVMDPHLAVWYAIAFAVIYIIAQQPAYGGLGTTSQLTPLQLETLFTEGNTSKFWMVEFRSLSTSSCIRSSSFFPELSITFSNKNLSFGIIDLGLFPNAAEKFGITLGNLHQLPTYMMFQNGAVISRLPGIDYEAKVFDSPVSKRLLCRHFELDKLFLDYINETEEERWICRDLACSIADRSPYAWHLYYGGEAEKVLSEKSMKALEIVMKRASNYEKRLQARKKLIFEKSSKPESQKKKRVAFADVPGSDLKGKKRVLRGSCSTQKLPSALTGLRRSRRRGAQIHDEIEEQELMKKEVVAVRQREIVCALFHDEMYPKMNNKGKGPLLVDDEVTGSKEMGKENKGEGKEKADLVSGEAVTTVAVKAEVVSDEEKGDELDVVPFWPKREMCIYVEDDAGNLNKFKVEEDFDPTASPRPDVPLSPTTSSEWDPDTHCFLVVRRGFRTDP